jgi:hypothetical protein
MDTTADLSPSSSFIWPILCPRLILNVARAEIGPDKRFENGQSV